MADREVFPTVGAVTVGFDGEWLTISQESTEGHNTDVVVIPNNLVEMFIESINRVIGGEA